MEKSCFIKENIIQYPTNNEQDNIKFLVCVYFIIYLSIEIIRIVRSIKYRLRMYNYLLYIHFFPFILYYL